MEATVERGSGWELRLGRWQDVLADVMPDALITDPPYGQRTHDGHNDGVEQVKSATGQSQMSSISYEHLAPADAVELAVSWMRMTRGWTCVMTSHDLIPAYEEAARSCGRYPFAPLPIVQKRPRLVGDGPASWAVWMCVTRPRTREFSTWGCLPGMYEGPTVKGGGVTGAKPLEMMRQIVRDYSRHGDVVCDPFAGSGTTLLAAVTEGRRAIGAEMDEGRFEIAVRRLRGGYTPPLFSGADGEGL